MQNVKAAQAYEEMLMEIGICQELTPPTSIPQKGASFNPTCCTDDPNDIVIHDGSHVCWHCGKTVSFTELVYYAPYSSNGKPLGSNNTISFERKRGYKVVKRLVRVNRLEFDPFQGAFEEVYGSEIWRVPERHTAKTETAGRHQRPEMLSPSAESVEDIGIQELLQRNIYTDLPIGRHQAVCQSSGFCRLCHRLSLAARSIHTVTKKRADCTKEYAEHVRYNGFAATKKRSCSIL